MIGYTRIILVVFSILSNIIKSKEQKNKNIFSPEKI